VLLAYAEGMLRLEGSESRYEGRLEIYHHAVNGVPAWGTVCSHGFDNRDATVACRSLRLGLLLLFIIIRT